MYRYGKKSTKQLRTLHPWLQLCLLNTLQKHDHSIDRGGRSPEQQLAYFKAGTSTLRPPKGKHLLRVDPAKEFMGMWSLAADITPFINGRRLATWGRKFGPAQQAQFAYFLGIFKEIADRTLAGIGWEIRLGVNWDMDAEILTDQKFQDWFHVELVWSGS